MFYFQLVVVVALLAADGEPSHGGGHMSEPVPDRPDLALPTEQFIAPRDLDQVRFTVGFRGYRMDQVDDVLDRLAREVEARDARIAELEGRTPGEVSADGQSNNGVSGDVQSADGVSAVVAADPQPASDQPVQPDLPALPEN
jgi:DivIVA domain-containing protein